MHTPYDWLSLIVFSGLVVLFLQRSTAPVLVDSIWHYLPPALGCAAANWLGNKEYNIAAIIVLLISVGYIFIVIKPFPLKR